MDFEGESLLSQLLGDARDDWSSAEQFAVPFAVPGVPKSVHPTTAPAVAHSLPEAVKPLHVQYRSNYSNPHCRDHPNELQLRLPDLLC